MLKMSFFFLFGYTLSYPCMCNWMLWCSERKFVPRLRACIFKSKLHLLNVFETHEAIKFNQYLAP